MNPGLSIEHDGDDDGRHAHQQRHREASLGGIDAHLAQNLEPLADDIGEVVEDLGEVAAGLALEHDGSDEEFDVNQGHALGQIDERVAHWHAELLLFVKLAEFCRHTGSATSLADHFEGSGERVSGANGASQRVDGFREQFLKFLEALVAPERGVANREASRRPASQSS